MRLSRSPDAPSKLLARVAVTGMSLAVLALGALAVWATLVAQNQAKGLSQAGVQTSGHLRALQALSVIDSQADVLEEEIAPGELRKLRDAQRVLDDALNRMEQGGVLQARLIADRSIPVVARLKPAVNQFLARPAGSGGEAALPAEDALEEVITELQVLLNDLSSDPSRLLASKLESVTATESTVRRTAIVLIPLGLGGVAACGWLLSLYRRRSEAAMRAVLATTAEEARTDELTGLPNRRALLEELELRSDRGESFVLTIADLNGFKRYNDTFGHPAGDALLKRLGRQLDAACEGRGFAARLGGDEFCVVFDDIDAEAAHVLLTEALSEQGEGFRITAASGVAAVPREAHDASAALRLADARMYSAKASTHPGGDDDALASVLMRMLNERHPGLGSHVEEVAALSVACAETLGLSTDDVQSIGRAAELHDLGKVAIPSAILTKPGALSDEEWEFMRRHSIIGERILGGVPSLARVAALVRSSHERWDGRGYPDGLAGEEIPLGARIIFAADSYCAMTEDRPYAFAKSVASTRRELLACAGAQFDPAVVTAFLAALDDRESSTAADAAPVPA